MCIDRGVVIFRATQNITSVVDHTITHELLETYSYQIQTALRWTLFCPCFSRDYNQDILSRVKCHLS